MNSEAADKISSSPIVRPVEAVSSASSSPERRSDRSRVRIRSVTAAAVLIGAIALLGIARALEPDSSGSGTHTQLGLKPCGFLYRLGMPCPSCGMTTAFSEVMHGRLWRGFQAQPAGGLLCIVTMMSAFLSAVVLATGRRIVVPWYRIEPRWILLIGLGLLLGSWSYKIVTVYASK
jgi:hypothetical protein